jgi:hypothetical protein
MNTKVKRSPSPKLTKQQIQGIIDLLKLSKKIKDISKEIGVNINQVTSISCKINKGKEIDNKSDWKSYYCKVCNKPTQKRISVIGDWYCSEHKPTVLKIPRKILTKCNYCNKQIKVPVKKGEEHYKKYCNMICYNKYRAAHYESKICNFCNKKIEISIKIKRKYKKSYCNISCYNALRQIFPHRNMAEKQIAHRNLIKARNDADIRLYREKLDAKKYISKM